jgi:hypothetical protein
MKIRVKEKPLANCRWFWSIEWTFAEILLLFFLSVSGRGGRTFEGNADLGFDVFLDIWMSFEVVFGGFTAIANLLTRDFVPVASLLD